MMLDYLLPVLYAVFLWWFSTGVIFFLNNRAPASFRWSLAGASAVLVAALAVVWVTAPVSTPGAAYAAFTCGLLAWGWQTMTYYMGFVTGPRKHACPPGCRGWRHFLHAVQTSLYHELTILATAGLLALLTLGEPNRFSLWTFLALWGMHLSAKLNVFLGVRNLNEEFLPPHLAYLQGFFRRRPINLLFPVSVTAGTVITVLAADAALGAPAGSFEAVGLILVAGLLGLAVLEHWFMVLPLPAGALWRWSLGPGKHDEARPGDDACVTGQGTTASGRGMRAQRAGSGSAGS